jgi:hypothetical protein
MLSGWGSPMSTSQRVNRGFHTLGLLLAGTCALSIVLMKPAIAACEQGTPVSGRFYVKGDEINFRTVPGTNYDSVVNQRATQVLGPDVWKLFGIRKEQRRSQGLIHGKRCGTTENIGPAARAGDNRSKIAAGEKL